MTTNNVQEGKVKDPNFVVFTSGKIQTNRKSEASQHSYVYMRENTNQQQEMAQTFAPVASWLDSMHWLALLQGSDQPGTV